MKKKIFSWVILAALIIPCMLLFAACGRGDEVGFKVVIDGKSFVSSVNVGVVAEYSDTINYSVYRVFENGEQEKIAKKEYSIVDEDEVLTTAKTIGTYTVTFAYASFADISIDIEIVPKQLVVPQFENFSYTGVEQTVYPEGFDASIMTISGNVGTIANDYTATVGLKDKVNYVWSDGSLEDKEIGWTIEKVLVEKPTLVAESLVYNYDNQNAPVSEFDSNLIAINGDTIATGVGDYSVTLSLKDKVNSAWSDNSIEDVVLEWSIEPFKIAKPVADETATYVYSGKEQTFQLIGFDGETMDIANDKQTNAGDNYKVVVTLKDATNTAWADDTTSALEFSWVITKREIAKPTVVQNFEYDGKSHTVEFTGFNSSLMTKTGTETATNAGEHSVFFELKDFDNNKWVGTEENQIQVRWGISKQVLTLVTLSESSFVYTGSEINVEDKIVGFNSGVMEILSGDKGTVAGDYNVLIDIKDDLKNNYKWEDNRVKNVVLPWTITKKEVVKPILSVAVEAYYYNTQERTVDYRGFDENTMEIVSGDKGTNAGDYTLIIKLKDPANYAWKDGSTENLELAWTIQKANSPEPEIPHSELFGTYDPAKTLTDYASQLETGYRWEDETILPTAFNSTYYALYNPDPQNYLDRKVAIKLNIEKAVVAAVTFVDKTYTYNKTDQILEINGFDTELMTKSGDVGKNAGSYTATVNLKDRYNYKWNTDNSDAITHSWTIDKCRLDFNNVSINRENEALYNGQYYTPEITGFDSESMTKSGTLTAKEPGDYVVRISLKDKTNYVWWISFGFGQGEETSEDRELWWNINKGQQSGIMLKSDISKQYDGNPITKTPSFTGLKENPSLEWIEYYAYENNGDSGARIDNLSDIWNVGKYRLSACFAETAHYDYAYVDIDFYIYHDLTLNEIIFSETVYSYYGEPVEPEPFLCIYQKDNIGNIYGEVTQYDWLTIAYANNDGMAKQGKIILTGDGKVLKGTVELTFDIIPPAELVRGWYFEGGYYEIGSGTDVHHNSDAKNPYLVEFRPVDTFGEVKGKFMYTVYSTTENVMIQGKDVETIKDGVYSFVLPENFYHVELYYYENGYVSGQNITLYNRDVAYEGGYEGHDFNYIVVTKYQDGTVVDCDSVTLDANNTLTISKSNCDLKIDMEENIQAKIIRSLVQITYNGTVIDMEGVEDFYGMIRRYKMQDLNVGTYVLRFAPYLDAPEYIDITIIVTE